MKILMILLACLVLVYVRRKINQSFVEMEYYFPVPLNFKHDESPLLNQKGKEVAEKTRTNEAKSGFDKS